MGTPVDEATLARLAQDLGDAEVMAELVDAFLAELRRALPGLREADASEEHELVRTCHTLKSSAAILGALKLSDLCREAEDAARLGDVAGAKARLPSIVAEIERVTTALRARGRGSRA